MFDECRFCNYPNQGHNRVFPPPCERPRTALHRVAQVFSRVTWTRVSNDAGLLTMVKKPLGIDCGGIVGTGNRKIVDAWRIAGRLPVRIVKTIH